MKHPRISRHNHSHPAVSIPLRPAAQTCWAGMCGARNKTMTYLWYGWCHGAVADNHSVNHGIAPEFCSLSYSSVDQAAIIMSQLGPNALLAKIDIAHAYRNIPVHPSDRRLLAMQWDGSIFIDTVLPFGLCSAPKIFSALPDTLERIFRHNEVSHVLLYLDDYFTARTAHSAKAI